MVTPVFVILVLVLAQSTSAAYLGKSVCQELWNTAANKLTNNELTVNANPGTVINPRNLFKPRLAASPKLSHAEFKTFRALLESYEWTEDNTKEPTPKTPTCINDFLTVLVSRQDGPVERAFQYLKRRGLLPAAPDLAAFTQRLYIMWFGDKGFRHTFVGDKFDPSWTSYSGFHNWFQFRLEPNKWPHPKITSVILGPDPFSDNTEPKFMRTFHFLWNNFPKAEGSSMFVGTSPAFEVALYSVCFIEYPGQHCSCHIGRSTITVQTRPVDVHNQYIETAFPKNAEIEDRRCVPYDPAHRTDCGWNGITEPVCLSRGCCYDNTHPNTKRCFYPRDHKCDGIVPHDRNDCGRPGITRPECENTGQCCFDESVPNVPFCFKGNF